MPATINHTAQNISDHLNGQIIGDPELKIIGLSPIESDEANTITFFGNPRYERHIYGIQPRAVIIPDSFDPEYADHITFIRVSNVYEALSSISGIFGPPEDPGSKTISTNSTIDVSSRIGPGVSIGHYSVVESGVEIGENCQLGHQVYIGKNVKIGSNTVIHSGVKIMNDSHIGSNCIIYANAVIGGDGFGYALSAGRFKKINHQARVIIEDDVEIGSNTCIDRGALKDTIIRKGAKLDNLIQIAHGVEVGQNVAIAAQSGISGSAIIGKESMLGGQVGVAGHVTIAEGSKIQGKSGVAGDIKRPHSKWYGYPVLSYFEYLRSYAIFKRLPELMKRLRSLENEREDDVNKD